MKTSAFFTLPLVASAALLNTRQTGQAVVAGVEKLTPQIKTAGGSQRTLTKFGPYTLNGAKGNTAAGAGGMMGMMGGMDSTLMGQSYFLQIKKGFCNENGPCTVFGGQVKVVYEDGTDATPSNGVYIHHILTSDTSKKPLDWLSACDNPKAAAMGVSNIGGAGFVGTGEDTGNAPVLWTTPDGKADSGYQIEKGDNFIAWAQLVNYNKDAKKVYVAFDLEWAPGKIGSTAKGILLSITSCRQSMLIKTSPQGPTNTTSGKFTFMEDGDILNARGHLHDGGVQVDLFINDKFACASKAVYGGAGATTEVNGQKWETISEMTYCDGPIPVKKGDTMTITVEYDLKKHPLRETANGGSASDVMGMLTVMFAPTKK